MTEEMQTTNTNTNTNANSYIQMVTDYLAFLMENPDAVEGLVAAINQQGETYFKDSYVPADLDTIKGHLTMDKEKQKILNRANFLKLYKEETNTDDDDLEEWTEPLNIATFDDAYRHVTFVDISDKMKPVVIQTPATLTLSDYCLPWAEVEKLPTALPPNTIAVHVDIGEEVFFPVPTGQAGGRRRRSHRRKHRRGTRRRSFK